MLANSAQATRHAHETKDLAGLIRGLGIELIEHLGDVRFTDPHTVQAGDGRRWHGPRIILAVGGHAASLPVPGGHLAMTYETCTA